MHDRQVEILGLRDNLSQRSVMRGRVDQLAVRHQRRRLRKPGWIPEGRNLALRLIASAGAPVEPVEGRGLKKQRAHDSSPFHNMPSRPRVEPRQERSVPRDSKILSPPGHFFRRKAGEINREREDVSNKEKSIARIWQFKLAREAVFQEQ